MIGHQWWPHAYTRADARLVVVSMVQLLYLPFEGFKLAADEYKEQLTRIPHIHERRGRDVRVLCLLKLHVNMGARKNSKKVLPPGVQALRVPVRRSSSVPYN